MKYTIDYSFTTLNEYINAERSNKYIGAKIKKRETNVAYYHFLNKPKIKTPCKIRFTWLITNKRKDADNIAFAKKFILDGMVKAQVIDNDNLNHIIGFTDEFIVCEKNGVIIEIEELM